MKKIFERPIIIDDPKPEPQPMPKPEPGKPSLEGEGYIIKEGNVFLLRFGDKILWPNNLPARYMVNKLEVKFGAEFILRAANQPTNELPQVDENGRPVDAWWKKYPEISFTYIHARSSQMSRSSVTTTWPLRLRLSKKSSLSSWGFLEFARTAKPLPQRRGPESIIFRHIFCTNALERMGTCPASSVPAARPQRHGRRRLG